MKKNNSWSCRDSNSSRQVRSLIVTCSPSYNRSYIPTLTGMDYPLGLPRVSTSKIPNLSKYIQNCQTKVYGVISASLRYMERKTTNEGTTKPRGGYRYLPFTVTVYLFLGKIRCLSSKLPNKGIPAVSYTHLTLPTKA